MLRLSAVVWPPPERQSSLPSQLRQSRGEAVGRDSSSCRHDRDQPRHHREARRRAAGAAGCPGPRAHRERTRGGHASPPGGVLAGAGGGAVAGTPCPLRLLQRDDVPEYAPPPLCTPPLCMPPLCLVVCSSVIVGTPTHIDFLSTVQEQGSSTRQRSSAWSDRRARFDEPCASDIPVLPLFCWVCFWFYSNILCILPRTIRLALCAVHVLSSCDASYYAFILLVLKISEITNLA